LREKLYGIAEETYRFAIRGDGEGGQQLLVFDIDQTHAARDAVGNESNFAHFTCISAGGFLWLHAVTGFFPELITTRNNR